MSGSIYNFVTELGERQRQELHALYQGEWWTCGRSLGDVQRMLENSDFVFALCCESDGPLAAMMRRKAGSQS